MIEYVCIKDHSTSFYVPERAVYDDVSFKRGDIVYIDHVIDYILVGIIEPPLLVKITEEQLMQMYARHVATFFAAECVNEALGDKIMG